MNREDFERARERMVSDQIESRGIRDARVLSALRRVPRHEFVPSKQRDYAYADCAAPIEEGQTISQPYIVGLMTQMLGLNSACRVLEIGTGCGYQTAVLAEIASEVYTVEVRTVLLESARKRLARLGYSNIRFRRGDGFDGWPGADPFDRIIVTACAPRVPSRLFEQLSKGGVMVLPVARDGGEQILCRVTRNVASGMDIEEGVPVRFVTMTGGHSGEEGEH